MEKPMQSINIDNSTDAMAKPIETRPSVLPKRVDVFMIAILKQLVVSN